MALVIALDGIIHLLDVTLSRVTQSGDPSPGMRIPGSHRGIRACIPDVAPEMVRVKSHPQNFPSSPDMGNKLARTSQVQI
jgi:hypothetical protein